MIKLRLTVLLLLYSIMTFPQKTDSTKVMGTPKKDSFSLALAPRPFWRSAGELLLAEAIPFTYNLISNTDFSHVSLKSIGNNLNISNWEFDVDKFLTNQFAHPYHGSLYYNAFRSTGHTFWQSVPAAFSGSLLWEIAGENTYPSYNDLVNTTLGGITLGEMMHRFSGLIINKKRHGRRRQMQEVLATLVNPMDGFNRILDNNWGRVEATDPEEICLSISPWMPVSGASAKSRISFCVVVEAKCTEV